MLRLYCSIHLPKKKPSLLQEGFFFITSSLCLCAFVANSYSILCDCRYSAIWIALVAAPLRRLSLTIHIFSVLGCVSSRRRRPTNTSSLSCAHIGIGYSALVTSSCSTT